MNELIQKGIAAKKAAKVLNRTSTEQKNRALAAMAEQLLSNTAFLLEENEKDLENARQQNTSAAIMDRLSLSEKRIQEMAEGLRQVIELADPVGEVMETFTRPNGLRIEKVRVPLGVAGIIYEARPNVTVDAAALCLKTGNAAYLRGSSSAIHSNKAIIHLIQNALEEAGLPKEAVQLLEDTSYETSNQMLRLNQYLDVLIPRGGAGLITHVVQNATVPVLETGVGNCHIYVDESAQLDMAINIMLNAKTQRPGVCNAVETVLLHPEWAKQNLDAAIDALEAKGVEIRTCEKTRALKPGLKAAVEADWESEFLDLILAVRTVDLDEAISHIEQYGSGHSECILTENQENAERFLREIDAAAVYHNASTRFTDGFEFGFGAEIGISTQKLHARGPMGLKELTSYKYLLHGQGQTR
ncbi:glutamate-5-semialdehyde dehydrogenase [Ammoniphilus sp. YIM 78166]|uniref:glutamate-5-semialdehyde dehydrogenase n=1 Tax=Ammoniphilus sp. YIM 78166 TaxID=1644106 RepID=UPI00106F7326|nr:glutamate-5-semialdehyde dehydrogenase [Ammoniphilus sp. YIM 78166]